MSNKHFSYIGRLKLTTFDQSTRRPKLVVKKSENSPKVSYMDTTCKAFPFSLPYAPQFLILIPSAGPRNSRSAGPQFPIARHAIPGSFLTGPGAAQFLVEIPIRISTTQFLIENPDFFVELYLGVLVDF